MMTSVGTLLRTERERQGREAAEIAEELCITLRYLRAIEQDDLKTLPGSFFYKSFVKQYAAILGLDDAQLRPAIEATTAQFDPLPLPGSVSYLPQPSQNGNHFATADKPPVRDLDPIVRDANRRYIPDSRIGLSVAGLAIVLLLCSLFYSWWNRAPQTVASAHSTAPSIAQSSAPQPEPQNQAAKVAAVKVEETIPADANHVVLNLSATEKTWLSIVSDGKEIYSGVLEPSQTKTLSGLDQAKVRIGNAGGLEIRWNGKPIGPVGPRGQVRVVLFTPDNFQVLGPSSPL